MTTPKIRVRFAPAPTGMMHLGNVRAALMNCLFAKQKNGTFILRIEDTDQERNFDPQAHKIIEDLTWLNLMFDEGPTQGGAYGPYFQSQREHIYQEKAEELKKRGAIYRCFCTPEELELKRERQRMLKLPPRYDRTCLHRSAQEIEKLLADNVPFIWRFKLDHDASITITDLAHGTIKFEMKNFSDFPLTRQDGSFTFVFANFVDDYTMQISHVFRGEDHLTNTAVQAALYKAFNAPLPIFFHMPILCNIHGQKLSKRDFGFSLRDLKKEGFTHEAIVNYLGIIGGSFAQEIMTLNELAHAINFDAMQTTGHIRYDVEKLRWMNHKWIERYSPEQLMLACKPFLHAAYRDSQSLDDATLTQLLQTIKTDLMTLADCVSALEFYFNKPTIQKVDVQAVIDSAHINELVKIMHETISLIDDHNLFVNTLKQSAQSRKIPLKELFWFVRLALMGKTNGPAIHDLLLMLGSDEAKERLQHMLVLIEK
jgi:nondiscriminating glutamyl-tRNA synthetase